MNQKKVIEELRSAMKVYSPAMVAVTLGYSDTRMLHQWLRRGKIPETKIEKVSAMLKDMK